MIPTQYYKRLSSKSILLSEDTPPRNCLNYLHDNVFSEWWNYHNQQHMSYMPLSCGNNVNLFRLKISSWCWAYSTSSGHRLIPIYWYLVSRVIWYIINGEIQTIYISIHIIYIYICVCVCVSVQHNLSKQPVRRKAMHFFLKSECQRA